MGESGWRQLCRQLVCSAGWGMRRRHELSEAEWARLEPLLPPKAGKPRKDDRLVINAILWKLATGARGGTCRSGTGPGPSVYSRFRRWTRSGVRDRMLAAVQRQADAAGELDWELHLLDGTVIRAHQHAAGAKGGSCGGSARPQPGRLVHEGPPPGGGARQAAFERLLEQGAIRRPGPGRPRAAQAGGGRQGLYRSGPARVLPSAGDPLHHPGAA
jgi:transposase